MLAVGDLLVVPFIYSLQARYLAFYPVELGPFWTFVILAVNVLGYYIFRTANGEKDMFRNGKNPKSKCDVLFFGGLGDRVWCSILLQKFEYRLLTVLLTDLTFMTTKRGTKLLTSGWWGRSRHPNYL